MPANAIPALADAGIPGGPFDFESPVSAEDEEPKPSFIVLLSGTVILQNTIGLHATMGYFSTHMKASMFKGMLNGLLIVI